MENSILKKRFFEMTGEEIIQLFTHIEIEEVPFEQKKTTNLTTGRIVYGVKGLRELLHCSESTAYSIFKSGRIDEAILDIGRKRNVPIQADKVLELLKNENKKNEINVVCKY